MSPPIEDWLVAFLLTCVCELPIVAALLHRRLGLARALTIALGAQFLTHPALWYLLPRFSPWWAWVTAAEIGIFIVEGAVFAWLLRAVDGDWRPAVLRGFGASFLANTASVALGLGLSALGIL